MVDRSNQIKAPKTNAVKPVVVISKIYATDIVAVAATTSLLFDGTQTRLMA